MLQICQSNYKEDLLKWVAPENLPEWLGGTSKGTLLDDCGPWSDPDVLRRYEAELPAARQALKHRGETAITPVPELIEADGYASPKWVSLPKGGWGITSTAAADGSLQRGGAQQSGYTTPGACHLRAAALIVVYCLSAACGSASSLTQRICALLSKALPVSLLCGQTQPSAATACVDSAALSPVVCCQVGGLLCVGHQLRQQRRTAAGAGEREARGACALPVSSG